MSTPAWLARSEQLHRRVRTFIASSLTGTASEPFDTLACDIARHQQLACEPLQRLYAHRGIDPTKLRRNADIPAVPCDAFRHRRIAVHSSSLDQRCFASSGTTAGEALRGRHPLRTTKSYAAGALAWARIMLWPDDRPLRLIALVEPEDQAPHSSLSFMLARFATQLSSPASWHLGPGGLDVEGIAAACRLASAAGQPALVAGTSFAFVHLLDALAGQPLPLPAGSRVMQTGGFKGRAREIAPAALSRAIAELFGLPTSMVVGEYGMTELSSQGYQGSLRATLGHPVPTDRPNAYHLPPWLRPSAVDPESLAPLAPAREGLCRLVDLANVDSAVAIQTADRVRVLAADRLELLGRQPGAPPRGCSLALEPLLERT